jgi:hypothetical protein
VAQKYMLINKHTPEQCSAMDAGMAHIPDRMKGKDFLCSCPFGEHGFWMILEGESSEEVMNEGLPPELRPGTRAIAIEVMKIPE